MLDYRYANATKNLMCKFNRYKLENVKNELINTHMP